MERRLWSTRLCVAITVLSVFTLWTLSYVRRTDLSQSVHSTMTSDLNQLNQSKNRQLQVACSPPELSDPIGMIANIVRLGVKKRLHCSSGEQHPAPVRVEYISESGGESRGESSPPTIITDHREQLRKLPEAAHLRCEYTPVHYGGENDYHVDDATWRALNESHPVVVADLPEDDDHDPTVSVLVRCADRGSGQPVYEDVHMFMPDLSRGSFPSEFHTESEWANVPKILVLCLDSLTGRNFRRSMPDTAAALQSLDGGSGGDHVHYLHGYTKVAENTLPNMIAFLTGRAREEFGPEDVFESRELDGLPYIWRLFADRGYATAMVDDNPYLLGSMLGYGTEGFTRVPTTFYPQPFWTYWSTKEKLGDRRNCLNATRPVPGELLRQVERFLVHAHRHRRPYFALSMLIRTTHDFWTSTEMADEYYSRFLRRNAPLLRDTVVVMMGDHGDRYSPEMTDTYWGHREAMMPLMVMRLPASLARQRPSMVEMLRHNRRRLTTAFDVHKSLVQLAALSAIPNPNSSESSEPYEFTGSSAYSVLGEPIPLNRTCAQARIDARYCVCDRQPFEAAVDPTRDQRTLRLARAVVTQLNSILPRCARYELTRVESSVRYPNVYWLDEHVHRRRDIEFTVRLGLKSEGGESNGSTIGHTGTALVRVRVTDTVWRRLWTAVVGSWDRSLLAGVQRLDSPSITNCTSTTSVDTSDPLVRVLREQFCLCTDQVD